MNDQSVPDSDTPQFRILSLDGGGIRGAFTAAFLAAVEKHLGCRICDHFDLVAGTSTGGIIAAAIAAGIPADRIVQFYRERGPQIFRRPKRQKSIWGRLRARLFARILARAGVDDDWLWSPKYDATALRTALEDVFAHRTMDSLDCCRAVIPSVDLTKGQTVVFKTPHLPGLSRDRGLRVVDVLLATTAAPTYFPHAKLGIGSAYVDGGLWANNPTMVAIAEALCIANKCNRPSVDPVVNLDAINVLSVGTGRTPFFARPPDGGGGIAWWLPPLIEVTSWSQSQGVHFQSGYVLGDRYRRVDFDVPGGSWKLDAVEVVDQLIHIGSEKAVERLGEIRRFFEQRKCDQYVAFASNEI